MHLDYEKTYIKEYHIQWKNKLNIYLWFINFNIVFIDLTNLNLNKYL